jgi:hypothetical protein
MTEGRYLLIRTLDTQDLRKSAGLDLSVSDEFTGQARPVQTLSGGEGFMAALCLALSLGGPLLLAPLDRVLGVLAPGNAPQLRAGLGHDMRLIAAMAVLYFVQGTVGMLALVGLIGFACSSIFSVIYSTALKCHPEKANEISGLMITGVCGGAVIPPLMGFTTDLLGSQTGSLLVISACMLYLAGCALALRRFAAK